MNNQIDNKLPSVNTSVPGPNSISFFSRHKEYVGQNSPFPVMVEKAQGAIIQSNDGKIFQRSFICLWGRWFGIHGRFLLFYANNLLEIKKTLQKNIAVFSERKINYR